MVNQDASRLRKFESSKMQLEWIVLVEDFPGKELQRLEVRQSVDFLSDLLSEEKKLY